MHENVRPHIVQLKIYTGGTEIATTALPARSPDLTIPIVVVSDIIRRLPKNTLEACG